MTSPISDALAKLSHQFAEQLPTRLDTIREHFQHLDRAAWLHSEAKELHRLVHSLTGSAGTFGMQSVSDAARTLEIRLMPLLKTETAPTEADWQTIITEMGRLDQLARIQLTSSAPSLKPPPAQPQLNRSPLIHLVEDDPVQADHLSRALQDIGYRVRVFTESDEFRAASSATDTERPDAIVMDMILPEGDTAGAELLAELKAGNKLCSPVVFASVRDDLAARLAAFRAGACRYLTKPVKTDQLIDLLDALTSRQPLQPYRILMVDDDPLLLDAQAAMLRSAGMEVLTLSKPLQIMDLLNDFVPDVVVLDVYMPEATGPELAAVLRERDEQLHLPILFLSAETDMTQQLLALNLGGDDFLTKPVQSDHLVAAVTARARRARQNNAIRQRLETTLYEREREHLALDHHAIVSVADSAGNITYINDKFCEISGYSRNELMGQNHRLIKSSEHLPEFYQNLWRTIAGGKVWQGEVCNRRKDGSLYWVESTITPFLDDEGKPYQYVSIRTDITHVKVSEEKRRKSEELLNQAQQVSHLGSFEWNPISGNLKWSDEHYRLWGLEPSSVMPSFALFRQGINPDDLIKLDEALQQAMAKKKSFDCVYRLKRPDGSERVLHSRGEFAFDDAGKPLKLVGTVQDITERRHAEQAAEAHRERFRRGQIFANIGTWDWNIQTNELVWSERIAPLFGHPAGDLETSYENFLAAIHPDDRQSVIDAVNACVERDVPYDIEHRVVWPDGTIRWLLERGAVVSDTNGKPLQMLGVVQDIDDRKRAELALAERERQLREAQTLARIGNWTADMVSGKLTWSDEIYRIFGHEPGRFSPSLEAFLAAVHPDDRARVRESEKHAQKTGLHDVTHRIMRPDGTVRHVHELAQAETDATGNLVRLTGTVQDITERVETEARLRETEERFTFAVEGAGDGVWDWDMRTNAMQFSKVYVEMLGYAENELPHHADTWATSVHPDDLAPVQQNLRDYLEGRMPVYAVEVRLRCKDGSYKWILCRGTIVSRDGEGMPVRMIGIHSDITERKRAEQALRESQEKLSGLFQMSPLGIVLTDMNGRYLEFNEAFRAICGYPAEELKNLDYWTLTPREYEKQEAAQLELLKKTGRYGPYEKAYRQKDGGLIPIRLNGTLIEDQAGHSQIWSIIENITDSKQAEQTLIAARNEADRANQAKSEFLSSMSHELRTPMNAVLGFGQLMEYDEELSDEHKDNVREILRAGHHLLELINEVLDLAKVESGHIDLSLEPVEVATIVEECLNLVAPLAEQRDIELSHSRLEGASVRADRMRLRQALLNLLSNAIKYNREGGSVHLDVRPAGTDRLRILLTDTGLGIPAPRLTEMFQPFNRLEAESSGIEGTGIGLTITRRIVEMMGGTVDVTSEVGVGSTFWIELPLESMSDATHRHNQEGTATDNTPPSQYVAQHTVLYIEDNPSNLRLVAQILGHRQHIHLLTAHTPELGIELALARRPELILLDINMPGMDGYQVLEVFKAEENLKSIPVVAITANAMTRDIERGEAAGFSAYLTKPLDVVKFFNVLERYLPDCAENPA